MMSLVIGFGNPLRQDDGFGWRIAEELRQRLSPAKAAVIQCHQLTPELAEPLSRAQTAIFIDARAGEPVGTLECEPISPALTTSVANAHHINPSNLLALAQQLYNSAPQQAYLVTARSIHFEHGDGLSPGVEAAMTEAVEQVCRLIEATASGADCAHEPE